ncbi:MAG TPA: tryptophan--tRNA ligase [Thermoplasmata archaeon]|nr:tryptophan--tRNA ligase [Thermoplasmata archaeon]HEV2429812.1 tryptophan--tRNA ligase [Thermoplasmata archaeon]
MAPDDSFLVTPYEVKGRIDYARLRELFGTQELTQPLAERIARLAGRPAHPLIRRGVYFSHRDLSELLDGYERGTKFFLYSGRGPSGPLHTAHLLHFELCRWLQEAFHAEMYIQITDDEKSWARGLPRETTARWGRENLLDILAVGFDRHRTHVFFDSRSIRALYPIAIDVARRVNYSTVKAVFGFKPSTNIGLLFYTALQSVPCFYPSWVEGRSVPCLIPCGIDQDPHFRITRDVAEPLGFPKPALLHSQMTTGLLGDRAMSTTGAPEQNAVFLNDPPKTVERKIRSAFTGGRSTVEEQRRLGAVPEVCSVWALWRSQFAPDDAEFESITRDCRSGALLCGECKSRLIPRVQSFLEEHEQRRKAVEGWAESLIVETPPVPRERPATPA